MRLVLDESAWEDYTHWQTADREVLKRISTLMDACLREQFSGICKPEQLKYGAEGSRSRRISDEGLVILQARYHHYNHHRPHTGIGGQTPSERVHNVTGKYS